MAKQKQKRIKTEGDFYLLILTLILCIFGLIMVYSASYYHSLSKYGEPTHYLVSTSIFLVIGLVSFVVIAGIDYHRFTGLIPVIILGVGLILLVVVLFIGQTKNNAQRWIPVFGFTIMPGEIIKTCLIIGLAWWLSLRKENINTMKGLLPVIIYVVVAAVLIALQPNISTAAVVVGIAFLICFVAGLSWLKIFISAGVAIFGIVCIILLKGGYALNRVTNFLDPWSDALGNGYQVVQGLLALGSGGVLGKGLGGSIQKALYLPEPENDFILAIIGEELGYVGLLVLLIVYILLIWRIFRAAVRAADRYGMLLAAGVGIHISVHVIINVAIISATFPPTGIILPFVSYGGNALILFIAEAGLAYNVSRFPSESCVIAKITEASK